jgi:DNA-binding response OmpR family regulator
MAGIKKILLIEDDPKSRYALHSVLQQHGHHVTATEDSAAARKLTEEVYDVAIIDVRLPDELGTKFAAQIKERSPSTRVIFITASRVIFITAYDDMERVRDPIEGAVILVKPIDMEVLLKLL